MNRVIHVSPKCYKIEALCICKLQRTDSVIQLRFLEIKGEPCLKLERRDKGWRESSDWSMAFHWGRVVKVAWWVLEWRWHASLGMSGLRFHRVRRVGLTQFLLARLDTTFNEEQDARDIFTDHAHNTQRKRPTEIVILPIWHPRSAVTHCSKHDHRNSPQECREK